MPKNKKTKRKKILALLVAALFFLNIYQYQQKARAADDVSAIQDKLDEIQKKKEKVQKQLDATQTLLQKNQSHLSTTRSLIEQTKSDIGRKEKELQNLKGLIDFHKKVLEEYLRQMYYSDREDPLIALVASNQNLDSVVGNFDQIVGVKGKILETLQEIEDSKNRVAKTAQDLADKKEDHEKLLAIQKGEQYELQSDAQEAKATLSELNAKINKLRGELSKLLGSAVSFKNILDAAEFASKVTGIRKDYLLGVLVVESNLGRYTGGCNYKESRMSGSRAENFKAICKELGYDYAKMKVSCPPAGYKGTGGAMGVAQFMPDTWQAYKSSIAAVTGHNPPNPWSLTDGVVAMALKLTKVEGVKEHKRSAEAKAYCIYLAGNNWASYCDGKGVNYGAKVLYWADNYEQKLN